MSLPRRDIFPVDPARSVAEEDPPSHPGAQPQPPQVSMDGSQLLHSGGESDHDGDETPVTDIDLQEKQPRKPPGDPDSSGDDGSRGRRGRHQIPITINKWAKPLPRLDLPATG